MKRKLRALLTKRLLVLGIVFSIFLNVYLVWNRTSGISSLSNDHGDQESSLHLPSLSEVSEISEKNQPSNEPTTQPSHVTDLKKTATVVITSPENTTKKQAFLVIGVPTVKRKKASYLRQTLRELVEGLDDDEKSQVLILVLITDFNSSAILSVVKDISDSFPKEINSGLIRVVNAPRSFYPKLDNLPQLWGDKPERIRWRTKQCLDYAFLFNYTKDLGQYYLQIEDDVSTSKGYLKSMKKFITANQHRQWSMLEFGSRGFIGMMYRTSDLGRLAMFVKMYHWALPIDFLNRQFNDFHLYGNPAWARHKPPLFRHLGVFSSLDGQLRNLYDIKTSHRIYKDSNNPSACLTTSLIGHQQTNISVVYNTINHGMFWAKNIKKEDYILVQFFTPVRISKVIVESGAGVAPEDYFGGVIASYSEGNYRRECRTFTVWQEFKDTGQLKLESSNPRGILCLCLKLEITEIRKDAKGNPRWVAVTYMSNIDELIRMVKADLPSVQLVKVIDMQDS